jgi:hypothetical protein
VSEHFVVDCELGQLPWPAFSLLVRAEVAMLEDLVELMAEAERRLGELRSCAGHWGPEAEQDEEALTALAARQAFPATRWWPDPPEG